MGTTWRFGKIRNLCMDVLEELRNYLIFSRYSDRLFDDVKYYTMFIGYAHSGHSVVGAILDAHPNMIIANELHALPKFKRYKYVKNKIFKLILDNSRKSASNQDRTNTGYNYYIPNLYQGKFENLEVIGDKKGGASSVYNLKHPEVLENLIKIFGTSLKLIHVVRNPYDNISAYAFRKKVKLSKALIESYFNLVESVLNCQSKLSGEQFYILHYEDLVNNKSTEIRNLCEFLGQEASHQYIKRCGQALYVSPHKRRYKTEWVDVYKELVESYMRLKKYERFFKRYEF